MGINGSCNQGPCAGKDPVETLTPMILTEEAAERVTGYVPTQKDKIKRALAKENTKNQGLDESEKFFKAQADCVEENFNKKFKIDKESVENFANALNDLKKNNIGFCAHEQNVLKNCLANNSELPLSCSDELLTFKKALQDEYEKIATMKKHKKAIENKNIC